MATLTLSSLPVGGHPLTAHYLGDTNDSSSVSNTISQAVQDTTSTALNSSPDPSIYGQSVTLTATVTATVHPGSGIPTGTVSFFDGVDRFVRGFLPGPRHHQPRPIPVPRHLGGAQEELDLEPALPRPVGELVHDDFVVLRPIVGGRRRLRGNEGNVAVRTTSEAGPELVTAARAPHGSGAGHRT